MLISTEHRDQARRVAKAVCSITSSRHTWKAAADCTQGVLGSDPASAGSQPRGTLGKSWAEAEPEFPPWRAGETNSPSLAEMRLLRSQEPTGGARPAQAWPRERLKHSPSNEAKAGPCPGRRRKQWPRLAAQMPPPPGSPSTFWAPPRSELLETLVPVPLRGLGFSFRLLKPTGCGHCTCTSRLGV